MSKHAVDKKRAEYRSSSPSHSPTLSKVDLATLQSISSADGAEESSPETPGTTSKSTALRDDVLLDVKYLKDVYQGLDDDTDGR
mgnify:CR=1 FL=1